MLLKLLQVHLFYQKICLIKLLKKHDVKNTKIIKDFEIWMEVKYRAKNVGQIIRAIS